MIPIFFVHLNLFGYNTYFDKCVEITCHHNQDRDVFVITATEEVQEHLEGLLIQNLTVLFVAKDIVESISQPIDAIMYHDEINPRHFELTCFVRHHVLKHLIDTHDFGYHIASYIVVDSDSAIFTNVGDIFPEPTQTNQVQTFFPICTNFGHWSKSALDQFCSSSKENYFHYAKERKSRTSDMFYLGWSIQNRLIEYFQIPPAEETGIVCMDTFRQFMLHNALFTDVEEQKYLAPEMRDEILKHPAGLWRDPEFLRHFIDPDFCKALYGTEKINDGTVQLNLKSAYVLSCQTTSQKRWRNFSPFYSARHTLNASVSAANLRLGMLHFQGAAKEIVKPYYKFWKSLQNNI